MRGFRTRGSSSARSGRGTGYSSIRGPGMVEAAGITLRRKFVALTVDSCGGREPTRLDITPLMPRHRIEAPRQRTLWRTAEQSARRVRFRAAGRRETPGHAKPAVAPQWRQRLTRNQRRRLKRAGRRLLVSPWFAAGAGVVIATGVMIYTPHTKFAIDVHQCQVVTCTKLTPQGVPPVPAVTGAPVPLP